HAPATGPRRPPWPGRLRSGCCHPDRRPACAGGTRSPGRCGRWSSAPTTTPGLAPRHTVRRSACGRRRGPWYWPSDRTRTTPRHRLARGSLLSWDRGLVGIAGQTTQVSLLAELLQLLRRQIAVADRQLVHESPGRGLVETRSRWARELPGRLFSRPANLTGEQREQPGFSSPLWRGASWFPAGQRGPKSGLPAWLFSLPLRLGEQ